MKFKWAGAMSLTTKGDPGHLPRFMIFGKKFAAPIYSKINNYKRLRQFAQLVANRAGGCLRLSFGLNNLKN